MVFNATVTHKFVWTDTNGNITGGYQGPDDTPELQNACNPWVGIFAGFDVNFTKYGKSGY